MSGFAVALLRSLAAAILSWRPGASPAAQNGGAAARHRGPGRAGPRLPSLHGATEGYPMFRSGLEGSFLSPQRGQKDAGVSGGPLGICSTLVVPLAGGDYRGLCVGSSGGVLVSKRLCGQKSVLVSE